jgi:hypothetical protein
MSGSMQADTSLAGSDVAFRAIFHNGYGGTSLGCIIGGAINAFCTNGMILGDYDVVYRRHTSGLDASIAVDWLKAGMAKWDVVCRALASLGEGVSRRQDMTHFEAMSDNEQHVEMMARVGGDLRPQVREHALRSLPDPH